MLLVPTALLPTEQGRRLPRDDALAALRPYGRLVPAVVRVLLLAIFQVVGTVGAAHGQNRTFPGWAGVLLVAGPVSLLAVRRLPWLALGVSLGAAVTWFALGYPGGPVPAAFVAAVISSVLHGHRVQAWVAVAAGGVALWVAWALGAHTLGPALGGTAWLVVLVAVAEQVRTRRQQAVERRAARREEERRRASEERLNVARELHDVLAHSVSLISVHAGVALHLLDSDLGQVRTSLETIRDASRDTLTELRATVGALRAPAEDAPLRPTPGLASLPSLVSGLAGAGFDVRSRVEGTERLLPPAVDLAAYRIVQEALTNVTRHASATHADVVVTYGATGVTVQVTDDGHGGAAVRVGNGLTGMRERALALGGSLVAGPRPQGGFRVEAVLPL
ncbi:MAG: two-component sensor histidine kinase [Frankiales bacterium]|nr:two-component sensor histidine kinase [Frankiales bacterium]